MDGKDVIDSFGDGGEGDFFGQKGLDEDLVGGVGHRRRRPTFSSCLHHRPKRRVTIAREFLEVQSKGGQAQRDRWAQPLRVAQGGTDGNSHVRGGQLGKDRAIPKLQQGMHDGLRVKKDTNPLPRHPKKVMGLDDLEGLVHQSRGIHSDPRPHLPGGMAQGFLWSDRGKRSWVALAKRATGGSDPDPLHFFPFHPGEKLPKSGMFGVHRDDLVRKTPGSHYQLSAYYQGLFIG
jgi:hypothetical protein